MRKFIVSDLHGNGSVYDSIMVYLDNVNLVDGVELYINGDLIDRGIDSYRMINDVIDRINDDESFKIHYLAGNHELMMYQSLLKKKREKPLYFFDDWMRNGGWVINDALDELDDASSKIKEYLEFLPSLEIYHKFDEVISDNKILLVHAQAPKEVHDKCHIHLGDNDRRVSKAVWTRENEDFPIIHKLGKNGYLTIIGHTPVLNKTGFIYNKKDNYLNIDGGCSAYALSYFEYDHVPLIEVEDDRLLIFIWNHNNEIIDGYIFDGEIYKMSSSDLEKNKLFIDHNLDGIGEIEKKRMKEKRRI